MRISDWSSDVCSSDRASPSACPSIRPACAASASAVCTSRALLPLRPRTWAWSTKSRTCCASKKSRKTASTGSIEHETQYDQAGQGREDQEGSRWPWYRLGPEIGRASCRERVGQYV